MWGNQGLIRPKNSMVSWLAGSSSGGHSGGWGGGLGWHSPTTTVGPWRVRLLISLGVGPPFPSNSGKWWRCMDPNRKNVTLLVVTGILGRWTQDITHIHQSYWSNLHHAVHRLPSKMWTLWFLFPTLTAACQEERFEIVFKVYLYLRATY